MLEKLVPGDRVIKIPTMKDEKRQGEEFAPFGASGVILEGECEMKVSNVDTGEIYKAYGCVVLYDRYPCPWAHDQAWFRIRSGLMKISPDEGLIHEEEMRKVDDLNEEIKRTREELKEHPEHWSQTLRN